MIRYNAGYKEKALNLQTIKLTTQGLHSQPGHFHMKAVSGLTKLPSALTDAAAHWKEENCAVSVDVQAIRRPSVDDQKRLGSGWLAFSGLVNNDSLIRDGQYRSVPVEGFYQIEGFEIELTFDADCPPTPLDFSM